MSINNKQWLGLPLNLLWGYIAIAVFMTGDGFELAFLSHYIKENRLLSGAGFICLYPLRPGRGAVGVDLRRGGGNYYPAENHDDWLRAVVRVPRAVSRLRPRPCELCADPRFYGIRGFAYPLFLYSFIVAIIHNVKSDNASSAIGWFWAVYSIGIGVFGSYIPSFTIPHIGELGTLWLALAFCVTGGIIALASLRHIQTPRHMQNLTTREKFSELGRAATLLYTNRNILLSSMVRIINTLSLFGFAVIMPMMFVDELGFTTSEWLQVWAVFFFTTIFSNVLWGILGKNWAG